MKTPSARNAGFTLIEIMIVVAIIGLLASIAIPNYVKSRGDAQRVGCISNLEKIDGAKAAWSLEHGGASSTTPQLGDIQPYLGRGKLGTAPHCPADSSATFASSYAINDLESPPACLAVGDSAGHRLP